MATNSPDGHIYRRVSTAILNDEWFRNLPIEARYLFLLIILSPQTTLLGVNLNPQLLFYESNLSRKRAKMVLHKLHPKVIFFEDLNLIWVKNFPFWQCTNPNQWKSAFRSAERFPLELQRETLTYILSKKPDLYPLLKETLSESLPESLWQSLTETLKERVPEIIDNTDKQINRYNPPYNPPLNNFSKTLPKNQIYFDYNTGQFQNITSDLINYWREKFPELDIPAEIKAAEAWCLANPGKRKKDWRRFLTNWFLRQRKKRETLERASPQNLEFEASQLWGLILKGEYPPEAREVLQQMGGIRAIRDAPTEKIPILRSQFIKIFKTLKGGAA